MFTPRLMRKVFVSLGLLGGMVLAGDVKAAPRRRAVPTLELALRELESAFQTDLVKKAEGEVAAALEALTGATVTIRPIPQPPQGLFVLHNRHKLRRALLAVRLVQRDLRRNGSPPAAA